VQNKKKTLIPSEVDQEDQVGRESGLQNGKKPTLAQEEKITKSEKKQAAPTLEKKNTKSGIMEINAGNGA